MRWGELSRGTIGLLVKVCNGLKIQSFEQHGFNKQKKGFWDFSFTNILSCLAIAVALVTLVIYIKDSSATTKQRDRISDKIISETNKQIVNGIRYNAYIGRKEDDLSEIILRGDTNNDGTVWYIANSPKIIKSNSLFLVWRSSGGKLSVYDIINNYPDNYFTIKLQKWQSGTLYPETAHYIVRPESFKHLKADSNGMVYLFISNDELRKAVEDLIDGYKGYPKFKISVVKT
ncbi:hypothetical protein [Maridesulfovibrio sp.]|uniref:hypothetical protein n=1 Tax=Maridesulfovibrio sp. TaxID=2795000 RepID=UPI0029F59D4E|nr:hypothetical protein [Maridesulfovibrio sp.]